ncbi:MAG: hypothetical protein IJS26_00735 [Alphaproteobacteria bacterium]|nr:hypothetical protein [Alphaproteobacteria bacterium]
MRKFLGFAFLLGSFFAYDTAFSATGLTSIDYDYGSLTTNPNMSFSDATSSDYDFWLPVGGVKRYYKYVHTPDPSFTTSGHKDVTTADTYSSAGISAEHYITGASASQGGAIKVTTGNSYRAPVPATLGDFVENTATSDGGGIYYYLTSFYWSTNQSYYYPELGFNNANFVNNSATYTGGGMYIKVSGTTKYCGKYTCSDHIQFYGGTTKVIQFYGNTAQNGGGMYITGKNIGYQSEMVADFIANSATKDGGALCYGANTAVTSFSEWGWVGPHIYGSFIGNSAGTRGGAIFVQSGSKIEYIEGNFIGNTATQHGGAIYNSGTIDSIVGDFVGNTGRWGGAIYNDNGNYGAQATIGSIVGNFIENEGDSAIYVGYNSTINSIRGNFENNAVTTSVILFDDNADVNIGSITGNFINNTGYALNPSGYSQRVGLLADTQSMEFYNNAYQGAYIDINLGDYATVNMNAASGNSISFGGSIIGESMSSINLNNDSSADNRGGQYIFNNTVSGNRFNLYNFGQFC